MKKIWIFILIAVLSLSSCSHQSFIFDLPLHKDWGCQIYQEDGNSYIKLRSEEIVGWHPQVASVSFDSLEEMQKILSGRAPTDEGSLNIIRCFPKDKFGRIPIVDIENLCVPQVPNDLELFVSPERGFVSLMGTNYAFHAQSRSDIDGTGTHATIQVGNESAWRSNIKKYEDYFDQETITIISTESVRDRNATVYNYTTGSGRFKKIRYEMSWFDKKLVVDEYYQIEWFGNKNRFTSDTVPQSIEIIGQEKDGYFWVYIMQLQERPSLSWLQSFGLKKY